MTKTNVIRILESKGIAFETKEYEVDEEHLDAVTVAEKVGRDSESVFKTLVARTDGGAIVVFIIPGPCELDLKKAARASGSKSVAMVKVSEIQALTGYVRGGCSPIGMKKLFPTFIDETALIFETISVSAGSRGMQVFLKADDLLAVSAAEYRDLI